jgi:hypothetical protein
VSESPVFGLPEGLELVVNGVDVTSTCPYCGGQAVVPQGAYEFIEEAERVIADWTPNQRRRLSDRIQRAQSARNRRAATEAITAEPGLKGLARRYLAPKNAGEFWALVAVLVTLLGIGVGVIVQDGNSTETVNQTVNEKIIVEPSSDDPQSKPATREKPPGAPSKSSSKGKSRRQRGGGSTP